MNKPNCYECKYKKDIIGDAHIKCTNNIANVEGDKIGITHGWFNYPYNFDPIWLKKCDGFKKEGK